MAGLAERAISNAVEALVKRDTPLAEKTTKEDAQINEMEINIEGSEGWVSFYRADLLP